MHATHTGPVETSGGSRRGDSRMLESVAIGVGAASFGVAVIAALVAFDLRSAAISGPGSLGEFAAITGAIVAAVAFVAGRIVLRSSDEAETIPLRPLDVLDIAALSFAHGVIALLAWVVIADVLSRSFIGAEVFPVPLLVLAGAAAAVTGYVVFSSATLMDLQLLAVVLAVFLAVGILTAMLTAGNPTWWKDNLSALGITHDLSALAFNLTLVVAGVLVTTLARYATSRMPTATTQGSRAIRACLILIGVLLALVGLFPVDRFFLLHTAFASGMVVVFAVAVIGLPRWVPGTPRVFSVVGYAFLAVTVLLSLYFVLGVYTLTSVELVAGVLVFTWIILFIRNLSVIADDHDYVTLPSSEDPPPSPQP